LFKYSGERERQSLSPARSAAAALRLEGVRVLVPGEVARESGMISLALPI
jgi:hypothetical protein